MCMYLPDIKGIIQKKWSRIKDKEGSERKRSTGPTIPKKSIENIFQDSVFFISLII